MLSNNRESRVKRHLRKGRAVAAHSRKTKEKKRTNKALYAGAGILGTSTAGVAVLRARYRSNLDKEADKLRKSKEVANIKLKPNQKGVVFYVSGFFKEGTTYSADKTSRFMAVGLRNETRGYKPITFNFDAKTKMRNSNLGTRVGDVKHTIDYWSQNTLRGRNPDAIKLATESAAIIRANPDKAVLLVGFSQGGAVSREAAYLLQKAGFKNVRYAALGSSNFNMLPKRPLGYEFMGEGDHVRKFNYGEKIKVDKITRHHPGDYVAHPKVKSLISKLAG